MVGAFVALVLVTALGLSPLVAVPVALAIGLALGFVFYYLVIRRLIKAPELASLLATFAIGILLEEIAKALVDHPEDVVVKEVEGEQTTVLELKVAQEDLGKVIGKQGRTARSIRTILASSGMKLKKRIVFEIIE
mgnify:CR=1 FL=1